MQETSQKKSIQKSLNKNLRLRSDPDLPHQLGRAFPCHPVFVHFTAPQRLPHCIGETESSTESTKKPHFSLEGGRFRTNVVWKKQWVGTVCRVFSFVWKGFTIWSLESQANFSRNKEHYRLESCDHFGWTSFQKDWKKVIRWCIKAIQKQICQKRNDKQVYQR